MNVATLISGGVDSSLSVHLLKEQGIDPTLFYIRIGMDEEGFTDCSADDDIEISSLIAQKYGLKLEIVDLHRDYWDNVVAYTIEKVRQGFTPNPDVMCNKLIKFGCFEERYGKDFDKTVTGHYARTEEIEGKVYLCTAADPIKDQTDFLAQINYLQVKKLWFPIGHLVKEEVRALAARASLPSAMRKDSQGICFLGKVNYNDFIRRYLGTREGRIVELETGKILGVHQGFWFHTIGQRKGLGLAGGPWFVVGKNLEENVIYVSHGYQPEAQYGHTVYMHDFNFITEDLLGDCLSKDIRFKIRHTSGFMEGRISKEDGIYRIDSGEKLQGIAAGQFGVVYDEQAHICIGSGEIVNEQMVNQSK